MKNKINDLLFKDKINFIFSSRKITRKILAIGLLVFFSCFFTLSAQQAYKDCLELERLKASKEGATFSEATEYAKEACHNKKITNSQSIENSTTPITGIFTSFNIASTGRGLKVGYHFPVGRVHVTSLSASSVPIVNSDSKADISATILGVDFVSSGGFLIGIGSTISANVSCSGCSNTKGGSFFNIGYLYKEKQNLSIGLALGSAPITADYEERDSRGRSGDRELLGAVGGFIVELGYIF